MKTISLEQLIALNDEMAALVRAGVPLDRGLIRLGDDLPGRLGKLATAIGRRLEAGESLSQVVSQTDSAFPPLYQAVIEAGIRSGRLSVALEGLSTSVRRVAELRRLVGISLIYPLVLMATAYGMFVFCIVTVFPKLYDGYHDFGLTDSWWLDWMWFLEKTKVPLFWVPPVLVPLILAFCWYKSSRFSSTAGTGWFLRRLPTFGALLRAGRVAAFAETLTLLVEQEVPLDEALTLAAETSGDRALQQSSRALAAEIRSGQLRASNEVSVTGFPPLLGWLIASGGEQSTLVRTLRHVADTYRDRAQRMNDWLLVYLPIALSVGVGGTATIVLALSVLGPWFNLLYQLAQPN